MNVDLFLSILRVVVCSMLLAGARPLLFIRYPELLKVQLLDGIVIGMLIGCVIWWISGKIVLVIRFLFFFNN